jgi:hypothetical protein
MISELIVFKVVLLLFVACCVWSSYCLYNDIIKGFKSIFYRRVDTHKVVYEYVELGRILK